MHRIKLGILAVSLLAARAGLAQPVESSQVIRVESERVLLDVFVFDRDGAFVSGLQPEDFEVLEAGRPRPVANLIEIDRRATAATGPARSNLAAQHRQNRVVVILDRVSTTPADYIHAIQAVRRLIETLPPEAQLALFVYDGRLRFLQGFTRDRQRLADAVQKASLALPVRPIPERTQIMEEIASLFSERLALGFQITDTTSLESVVRQAVTDAVRTSNRYLQLVEEQLAGFFNSMQSLVEALGHVPGTKNVILLSRGYALHQGEDLSDLLRDNIESRIGNFDPSLQRNLVMQASQVSVLDYYSEMSRLTGLSNARQVRFYTVDPSGLQTLIPGGGVSEKTSLYQVLNLPERRLARDSRALSEPVDSLAVLSQETNGLAYYRRNDLNAAIDQILQHNSRFYLLGYEPSPDRKPGKFYRVKIKLKRPGKFKLMSKKGYLYEADSDRRPGLDYVLAYPGLFRDIPFEAAVASFRSPAGPMTAVSLEIPGSQMPLSPWNHSFRARLQVAGVFLDKNGKTVEHFNRPFEVFLAPDQYQQYREKSFIFYHEASLQPGSYQLRAMVSELDQGTLGATLKEFVVPPPAETLELSDLVLTQDIRPASEQRQSPMFVGNYRVVPEGDSLVRPEEPVYVYFQVYNLGQQGGAPRGRVHYQLEDERGAVLYLRDLPIRQFNLANAVAVSQPIPLAELRLPGGRYRVKVRVDDEISGQSAKGEISIHPF